MRYNMDIKKIKKIRLFFTVLYLGFGLFFVFFPLTKKILIESHTILSVIGGFIFLFGVFGLIQYYNKLKQKKINYNDIEEYRFIILLIAGIFFTTNMNIITKRQVYYQLFGFILIVFGIIDLFKLKSKNK